MRSVVALVFVLACFAPSLASAGPSGRFEPRGIVATTKTLADVRSLATAATGSIDPAYAERRETYRTVAKGTPFVTVATFRGADVALATTLAGSSYESGRRGGRRWRRTPSGTVRVIASDVQGDDLDRWPFAVLGFDYADCTLAGQTNAPQAAYVLECRPAGDVPHWLYVDAASGDVVRETLRDGSRVVSFAFADFRATGGVRRPFAWHVDGAGGPADVTVTSVRADAVPEAEVAIPPSVGTFTTSAAGVARLRTRFTDAGHIFVDVTVDGHRTEFILDTGTTQMLIDGGTAHRFGLTETLDHTKVHTLEAGPVRATDVPFLTTDLSRVGNLDGILGNEFFRGYVVHVNYERHFVEIIPHASFDVPAKAIALRIACDEGMPLAHGGIGPIEGDRFALDTGSPRIVLPTYLRERAGQTIALATTGADTVTRYLEGPMAVRAGKVSSFSLGTLDYSNVPVRLERPTSDGIDIPLDAIVGTDLLTTLDLWFDYDDDELYAVPF